MLCEDITGQRAAVPITNNEIEGDPRMTNLHEKISGGWRSMGGARAFLAIRSYRATARKQGKSMLDVLNRGLRGPAPPRRALRPPDAAGRPPY